MAHSIHFPDLGPGEGGLALVGFLVPHSFLVLVGVASLEFGGQRHWHTLGLGWALPHPVQSLGGLSLVMVPKYCRGVVSSLHRMVLVFRLQLKVLPWSQCHCFVCKSLLQEKAFTWYC